MTPLSDDRPRARARCVYLKVKNAVRRKWHTQGMRVMTFVFFRLRSALRACARAACAEYEYAHARYPPKGEY